MEEYNFPRSCVLKKTGCIIFVNVTLKARLHCRIERAPGQAMISGLMSLNDYKRNNRVWNKFKEIYFIFRTPYICSSLLAFYVSCVPALSILILACAGSVPL